MFSLALRGHGTATVFRFKFPSPHFAISHVLIVCARFKVWSAIVESIFVSMVDNSPVPLFEFQDLPMHSNVGTTIWVVPARIETGVMPTGKPFVLVKSFEILVIDKGIKAFRKWDLFHLYTNRSMSPAKASKWYPYLSKW